MCTLQQIRAYQLKVSGPLLDRLDFVLTLISVGLKQEMPAESSEKNRYSGSSLNGTVAGSVLLATCGLTVEQTEQLELFVFVRNGVTGH